MSDDAETIIKRQGQLASKRMNLDTWWDQIAERVMPQNATFTTTTEEGQKRTERLFDGTAVDANEKFAAIIDSLITPRNEIWHRIAPADDELANDQESKAHLDRINKALFQKRYRPAANFASQKGQCYMSAGAFGNYGLFVEEVVGQGARYIAAHLKELYWSQNAAHQIESVYRRMPMEAGQIFKKWGDKTPPKIKLAAEKDPFQEFEIIHCVAPNEERKAGRIDAAGMPFSGHYVSVEDKTVIEAGGYREWPWAIGRLTLPQRWHYGYSPAMACWPAIATLNEEKKTILRAGQMEVEPPMLLREEGILEAFNYRPRALNYGAISDDGTVLAQPLKTGANIPLGLELMQLEREHILNSFLVSIFKVLLDNPQLTATQVLEIAQQKFTLLAPIAGRVESEDLGPMINREIGIVSRMSGYEWIYEDMPQQLLDAGPEHYKLEYTSPLARAARSSEGVAILRTLEVLPTAIGADPDSAYVIDVPKSLRELADINGMPQKLLRSEKDVAKIIGAKREQEQAQAMTEAAQPLSQAALNAAKAEQLRSGGM